MTTVQYVVRAAGGSVTQGVLEQGNPVTLSASGSQQISLNLRSADVRTYVQQGSDLHIVMVNGDVLVLENYFAGSGDKELFLSKEGSLDQVILTTEADGSLTAQYAVVQVSEKWSAYDDLVFLDVERVEPVVAPLAGPALGGLGLLGAGTAAAAGVAVVTGDDDDGSGSGRANPTVNDPDVDRLVGGTADDSVVITGTGEPGDTVEVIVGTSVQTTTIANDGTWTVTFAPADIPADGIYNSVVNVTDPNGGVITLAGPVVDIDTIGPDVDVTAGTQSTGDIVNGAEHTSGTVITGTGEAGATVDVTINGTTHTTTVSNAGTWSVTFAPNEIAEGEYDTGITIVSTDARGNFTTTTDVLVVDTVAPPADVNAVTGDDVINAAEASAGVTLTGTGEAGASISVLFQGVTQTTTVMPNGTWSVDYASSSIATGTYDSTITVTSTDAAGNSSTTTHDVHVDTENGVTLTTPIEGDNVINEAELAAGATLQGTAEPGSSVTVVMQGVSKTVTALPNGTWTATYLASEIPAGEYDAPITVTSVDPAGNIDSTSGTVRVDTTTSVSITPGYAGGDATLNAAEQAAPVTLTGTTEPGSTVQVNVGGVIQTAVVDGAGNWTAVYPAGSLPTGEFATAINVTSTDAAGNTATASSALQIDTVAGDVALSTLPIEVDDVINAVERADGVEISGTATPGLLVTVGLGAATQTVQADVNGDWATTFPASSIPTGEQTLPITASITDAAGNSKSVSDTVQLDTVVTNHGISATAIEGDNIINAAERSDGVQITGTTEPGSTVAVQLGSVTQFAVVDTFGNWTADFAASDIPEGTYTTNVVATATDPAGNTTTTTNTVQVDTEVDTPNVDAVTFVGADVGRISLDNVVDNFEVGTLAGDGTEGAPSNTQSVDPVFGTEFTFTPVIPDGTHLVVSSSDAAGNASGTLVVLEDNATNTTTIDQAVGSSFDIQGLNLEYAADTNLTLNEAQIMQLSGTSDVLQVQGGADDTLTLTNATKQAQTQTIDNTVYDVYTVGNSGAVVVVEQEVNVII
ncbi:MAG: Ig-like domain-containing protein [Pseudomonadota bacterium]